MRMRGPNGEVVEVIRYTDKAGYGRKVYRLSQHRVFSGEYETPEELGKAVDLATLVEEHDAG
jgi:hypothetical protein